MFASALLWILLCFAPNTQAATPTLVPRTPTPLYRSDVFYEGGTDVPGSLRDLRMATHEKFERWVLDFADDRGAKKGIRAPRFLVRLIPAEKIETDTGDTILSRPAKLILSFQRVGKNQLKPEKLASLIKRSQHIQKITVYPPIENGDTAMEFTFQSDAPVSVHQPMENEGRLVIDISQSKK